MAQVCRLGPRVGGHLALFMDMLRRLINCRIVIIIINIIYKKLQTIYLMLYKRQIKNSKNQKYKHERIR